MVKEKGVRCLSYHVCQSYPDLSALHSCPNFYNFKTFFNSREHFQSWTPSGNGAFCPLEIVPWMQILFFSKSNANGYRKQQKEEPACLVGKLSLNRGKNMGCGKSVQAVGYSRNYIIQDPPSVCSHLFIENHKIICDSCGCPQHLLPLQAHVVKHNLSNTELTACCPC